MVLNGEQKHITENYVSVPPALTITDETGAIWTLGFNFGKAPKGEYAFNVLRNGVSTGHFASRIERRKNEIWIFTINGWKRMNIIEVEPINIYGVGAKVKSVINDNLMITVKVYFHLRPEIPVVSFSFNPMIGGMWDGLLEPIVCAPDQWLYATIEPKEFDVQVMAYLGQKNLREIPVRKGVENE